jgi:predicted molibdopterin-dependent oxidoreductase YjgC
VRGLEVCGFTRTEGALPNANGVVIVFGDDMSSEAADFAAGADLFVAIATRSSAAIANADFVLPATTFAEMEGTFTNHEGRVQRFWPALQPPPLARPAWQILGVLLAGLDQSETAPATAADVFLRLGDWFPEYGGLSYDILGSRGALINDPVTLPAGAGRGA